MEQNNSGAGVDIQAIRMQLKEQRRQYACRPIIGERFMVPREGKDAVETILYRPKRNVEAALPVLFNMHGGAWVAGDAVLMDSFCALLAEEIPAMVVNLNYKKVDEQPFPYQHEEVCDAVQYFALHAAEYGVDAARFAVGGHSAGAHIAAGSAMRLKELDFTLTCQMLVYPCVDFSMKRDDELGSHIDMLRQAFFAGVDTGHRWLSPLRAQDDELRELAPAIIITCGPDELKPQGVTYAKRLIDVSVPVKYKEYPEAVHGFLEVNRPEYEGDPRRSPEQLAMTRDCEQYLIRELRACFGV